MDTRLALRKINFMKKIVAAGGFLMVTLALAAQQKQGFVTYDRTIQMQISFQGMSEQVQQMIPKSRTDKFELRFGNNQSLWQAGEQPADDDNFSGGNEGGGVQIRFSAPGATDVSYHNFDKGIKVDKRDLMDKTIIVDDSIHAMKWKVTGETKTILGHNCMKAVATNISQRTRMTMDNGKMERKEVSDTSNIVAWFATDIPVSAGPAEYQGQLPGLILDLDINNGRQVYKATSVSDKVDLAQIKEPTGKKHYTPEEFKAARDKMLEEMQKNNMNRGGPGSRRVMISN